MELGFTNPSGMILFIFRISSGVNFMPFIGSVICAIRNAIALAFISNNSTAVARIKPSIPALAAAYAPRPARGCVAWMLEIKTISAPGLIFLFFMSAVISAALDDKLFLIISSQMNLVMLDRVHSVCVPCAMMTKSNGPVDDLSAKSITLFQFARFKLSLDTRVGIHLIFSLAYFTQALPILPVAPAINTVLKLSDGDIYKLLIVIDNRNFIAIALCVFDSRLLTIKNAKSYSNKIS